MDRQKRPLEQPFLKNYIIATLNYLLNQHGPIVVEYVKYWLEAKGVNLKTEN